MNFLALPKDIQVMMIRNLHPQEAFYMFRLCKRTHDLIKESKLQDLIIKNFLNFRTTQEFEQDIQQLNMCTECNYVFPKKMKNQSIQIHYRKHKEGKQMQQVSYYNRLTKYKCIYCQCLTSNQTSHLCRSKQIRCCTGEMSHDHPWAETLCEKTLWFELEHKFRTHICKAKCKCCEGEFDPSELRGGYWFGYQIHYANCKEQKKIDELCRLDTN